LYGKRFDEIVKFNILCEKKYGKLKGKSSENGQPTQNTNSGDMSANIQKTDDRDEELIEKYNDIKLKYAKLKDKYTRLSNEGLVHAVGRKTKAFFKRIFRGSF
jgi:hypothetical protein